MRRATSRPTKEETTKAKAVKRKPRAAAAGYKLPDPIEPGEIITDVTKQKWKLGKSVGVGGFGEIYMASHNVDKPPGQDCLYVVKVEPHENGPLWTEMHFYHKVAKPELIESWMASKKLKFLGMPRFIGSGSHSYRGVKYRFMVMERFGKDLQKLLEANGMKFKVKTVLTLGIKILKVLEYIHSHGYVHADIKSANLLLGYEDKSCENVYLVDYGLACRYVQTNGTHKECKEDPRKAHDGTIEYLSRDAHKGMQSRRGDLEILGFNMLHWLCGKLPWEGILNSPDGVHAAKTKHMSDIPKLIDECFGKSGSCPALAKYLEYVAKLGFKDEPNYESCRNILQEGLRQAKVKDDGKLDFGEVAVVKKRKADVGIQEIDGKPNRCIRPREATSPAPKPRVRKNGKNDKKVPEITLINPTPAMLSVLETMKNRSKK